MTDSMLETTPVAADEASRTRGPGLRRFLTTKFVVGAVIVVVIVLFAAIAPFLVQDPRAVDNIGLAPPSLAHPLGTTQTGQDVLAQLAFGARGSLTIGVCVGLGTLILSAFFGIVGAYIGGLADDAFALFGNVVLIIPGLPLMIVIGSYVQQKSIFLVIAILTITGWAAGARVLRGQTLSVRNRDYVLAARVAGERTWRVICVEILPNLLPVMSSGFVFGIVAAVLGEAGLSFIGIGAPGSLTWGTMLANAQNGQALLLGGWWWFVPPGLLIALLGCGLALINFSIDEVINPRLRTSGIRKAVRRAKQVRPAPGDPSIGAPST